MLTRPGTSRRSRLTLKLAMMSGDRIGSDITTTTQMVLDAVDRRFGLGIHSAEGGLNPSGELRKRLDLFANIRPARSRAGTGQGKLTAVHKVNVMRVSDGLFLECVRLVAIRQIALLTGIDIGGRERVATMFPWGTAQLAQCRLETVSQCAIAFTSTDDAH